MNSLRLLVLTASCAVVFAPDASAAVSAASCSAAPHQSLVERRIDEEAARGLPALISFVNRTQPIYQLRVVDAVALIDAERERRSACLTAAADAVTR